MRFFYLSIFLSLLASSCNTNSTKNNQTLLDPEFESWRSPQAPDATTHPDWSLSCTGPLRDPVAARLVVHVDRRLDQRMAASKHTHPPLKTEPDPHMPRIESGRDARALRQYPRHECSRWDTGPPIGPQTLQSHSPHL